MNGVSSQKILIVLVLVETRIILLSLDQDHNSRTADYMQGEGIRKSFFFYFVIFLNTSFSDPSCFDAIDATGRKFVGLLGEGTTGTEEMKADVAWLLARPGNLEPHEVVLHSPQNTVLSPLNTSIATPQADTAAVHETVGHASTAEVSFGDGINVSSCTREEPTH